MKVYENTGKKIDSFTSDEERIINFAEKNGEVARTNVKKQ